MNRFKLMIMTMNRFRLLLFTTLLVAAIALPCGTSATYAQQEPAAAKPAAEKDAAAAKRKADAAVRARAKRDETIQRTKAAREYIKKVVEQQQSGTAVAPPDNAGKEGAK